jgi:ubiquinone/menaquinone biosynthesis methyltransferase
MQKTREFISNIFDDVSSRYDIANDIMSLGIHRIWKSKFVDLINIKNCQSYLDLSCGTGDIALRILKKDKDNLINNISLVDPSNEMLQLAKNKLINSGFINEERISFLNSTAENLNFANKFDIVTVSFGARNFTNLELGISNIYKSLKSGGVFYCMEFSPELRSDTVQKIYDQYLKILPRVGSFATKNIDAYQYLTDSIRGFLSQKEFCNMMNKVGFAFCDYIPLSHGIANIYVGKK